MSYTKNTEVKAERPESWTNIHGAMKIFGKKRESKNGDFLAYSTSIGRKQEDGTYKNCFFNVRFGSQDINPEKEGAFDVVIHKGFLSADIRDGKAYPVIVITDFDFI